MPRASAAIRMRSALSPSSRYWKPRPSSPTRSASGTRTSSYVVSHEATALRPIFGIARASTPSAWRSTRNSVMPCVGLSHCSSGVVRVSSRMRSASSAFDVHTLRPLIDVVVAVAHGAGRDARRVGAGVGLGDAERDVQRAGGDVGQVLLLHLLGAVDDDRVHAEHGQVQRRGAVHARARRGDLLEHRRRLPDALPAAAVALGDGDADPAARRHRRRRTRRGSGGPGRRPTSSRRRSGCTPPARPRGSTAGCPRRSLVHRDVMRRAHAAAGAPVPKTVLDRSFARRLAHEWILTDRRADLRRRRRWAAGGPSRTRAATRAGRRRGANSRPSSPPAASSSATVHQRSSWSRSARSCSHVRPAPA